MQAGDDSGPSRLLWLFCNLVGHTVRVSLHDGSVLEGNLEASNPDSLHIVLTHARTKRHANGPQSGSNHQREVQLTAEDIISIEAKDVSLGGPVQACAVTHDVHSGDGPGLASSGHGRNLVPWSPDAEPGESLSFDVNAHRQGVWDQFAANAGLGVESSYEETCYTTELDRSALTGSQRRDAELIASQIESNRHGTTRDSIYVNEDDVDEEELHASVQPAAGMQSGRSAPPALSTGEQQLESATGSEVSPHAATASPGADRDAASEGGRAPSSPGSVEQEAKVQAKAKAKQMDSAKEVAAVRQPAAPVRDADEALRQKRREQIAAFQNDRKMFDANFSKRAAVSGDAAAPQKAKPVQPLAKPPAVATPAEPVETAPTLIATSAAPRVPKADAQRLPAEEPEKGGAEVATADEPVWSPPLDVPAGDRISMHLALEVTRRLAPKPQQQGVRVLPGDDVPFAHAWPGAKKRKPQPAGLARKASDGSGIPPSPSPETPVTPVTPGQPLTVQVPTPGVQQVQMQMQMQAPVPAPGFTPGTPVQQMQAMQPGQQMQQPGQYPMQQMQMVGGVAPQLMQQQQPLRQMMPMPQYAQPGMPQQAQQLPQYHPQQAQQQIPPMQRQQFPQQALQQPQQQPQPQQQQQQQPVPPGTPPTPQAMVKLPQQQQQQPMQQIPMQMQQPMQQVPQMQPMQVGQSQQPVPVQMGGMPVMQQPNQQFQVPVGMPGADPSKVLGADGKPQVAQHPMQMAAQFQQMQQPGMPPQMQQMYQMPQQGYMQQQMPMGLAPKPVAQPQQGVPGQPPQSAYVPPQQQQPQQQQPQQQQTQQPQQPVQYLQYQQYPMQQQLQPQMPMPMQMQMQQPMQQQQQQQQRPPQMQFQAQQMQMPMVPQNGMVPGQQQQMMQQMPMPMPLGAMPMHAPMQAGMPMQAPAPSDPKALESQAGASEGTPSEAPSDALGQSLSGSQRSNQKRPQGRRRSNQEKGGKSGDDDGRQADQTGGKDAGSSNANSGGKSGGKEKGGKGRSGGDARSKRNGHSGANGGQEGSHPEGEHARGGNAGRQGTAVGGGDDRAESGRRATRRRKQGNPSAENVDA